MSSTNMYIYVNRDLYQRPTSLEYFLVVVLYVAYLITLCTYTKVYASIVLYIYICVCEKGIMIVDGSGK